MGRFFRTLVILGVIIAGGLWFASAPPSSPEDLAALTGDAEAGRVTFAAAGCASCHVAPGTEPGDTPVLAGGKRFTTDFGTFIAPNISPDPNAGIGGWSDADLIHAVQAGVSPSGSYYFPVFPTHAYGLAETQDVADIVAYLRTLPADATPSQPHEIGLPFNIRRAQWGWRLLFAPGDFVMAADTPDLERGRYLVETLGHCAECHTPRNGLGGLDRTRWMAGAPLPTGEGKVPGLTPDQLFWDEGDIIRYLTSGFTPEFDVAGGEMAEVVLNTAQLSDADRAAIAAYIVALPPQN